MCKESIDHLLMELIIDKKGLFVKPHHPYTGDREM